MSLSLNKHYWATVIIVPEECAVICGAYWLCIVAIPAEKTPALFTLCS